MELRRVRYLVAVAETLSFRQASKQLHVSQPSLSVQSKNLKMNWVLPFFGDQSGELKSPVRAKFSCLRHEKSC